MNPHDAPPVSAAHPAHDSSTPAAQPVIHLHVNKRPCTLSTGPTRRLSDALRDELGLTGTKIGCHAGDCGACTVLLDGEQACACLVAVGQCAGREVTTVEGLAGEDGELSPLQQAFVQHGAAQCGICTPGMLMTAQAYLDDGGSAAEDDIPEAIAGNLCRCTGYTKIIDAIEAAAVARKEQA